MKVAEQEVSRSAVESADASQDRKYVIIIGERPTASAPTLTLSKALGGLGVEIRFASADRLRRREWMRLVRSASAIVLVSYHELDVYVLSQLATAVALDVPIVRWWVGSDVLNAITRDTVREDALRVDRIVSENVAVAPHLVDELSTIGIRAHFVPSVLDPEIVPLSMEEWSGGTKPVLIYLPDSRKEFYGLSRIEPVIAANPDIEFIVVADRSHTLDAYPNVENLGWVSDMRAQYSRAGCVLRVTEHDGLPRMLLEALMYGLYAIYSWPLDGCWEARTPEEITVALDQYREMTGPNIAGRAAVLELLRSRPDQQMSGVISDASVAFRKRVRAMNMAVRTKIFPHLFG
jgi:hypothetical protein